MASSAEIPDPITDFKAFQASLFKALGSATVAANSVPLDDFGFYRSLDRSFASTIDDASTNTLSMANKLIRHCADYTGIEVPLFEDVDDVKHHYGNVIDVVDNLLEKADICLDDMLGRSVKAEQSVKRAIPEITQISATSQQGKQEIRILRAGNVTRPQLKFKDRIDNSAAPFQHKLAYKPHAMIPLENIHANENGMQPHPYRYEIEHTDYPTHIFERHEVEPFPPFDTTSATWVDTDQGLQEMMDALHGSDEIAVDLEHHDYRSYQGFTCLMQISTRNQDFLIDTLQLRDKLWQLNEYFADPSIVKIFHGAASDVKWLQRDFSLYIVNLFDTYWATKLLNFPHHSLAFLLKKYCDVTADKQYQLADWRIRPVPEEMAKYARTDTHYLHYIYDRLRLELLDHSGANDNMLRSVLQRSAEVALTEYVKEEYHPESGTTAIGWARLLDKVNAKYWTAQQLAVYKAIHAWRDHTAREEDESVRFVLPNHMLFALVEKMPTDGAAVIGCCNPCPVLVRMNAQALALLIQRTKMDALESALTKTTSTNSSNTTDADVTVRTVNAEPTSAPTPSMTQIPRTNAMHVDPAAFNVKSVQAKQRVEAAKYSTTTSALFGTTWGATIPSDRVMEIRNTLRLVLPTEHLKMLHDDMNTSQNAMPEGQAPFTNGSQKSADQEEEHVFVPKEERRTKKRRAAENADLDEDVVVLRDTSSGNTNSKKKKKKNKKKKTE